MKNNKGFTLVEILSVIVLIALLLGLGIPGVMKISERMKERSFKTKTDLVEQAAILYGQDNKTLLQSDSCTIDGKDVRCKKLTIKELIEEDFLDSENNDMEFNNPINNDSILENCVYIYKKNNRVYAEFDKEKNVHNLLNLNLNLLMI